MFILSVIVFTNFVLFTGRGDGDFDRRGQQRDFFGAGGNRFGHGNRNGPMMGRGNGPQFNNRTSPMFMRGGARQNGPQGM